MRIQGLQKTTLLDYPGHVAATIFLGGCNFRCPFCHNMNIVGEMGEDINEEELFRFLNKRSGVIEGVCITGGEPTIYKELPEFIRKIKEIGTYNQNTQDDNAKGLLVKLDTNGTNPEMIRYLIDNKLIDYIAMDVKSSEDGYCKAIGLDNKEIATIINSVKQSIKIIMDSGIEYEFRTTIVNPIHSEREIIGIGNLIYGADRYFIQSFLDSEYVKDHTLASYDKDTLLDFASIISKYVKNVSLRGVD